MAGQRFSCAAEWHRGCSCSAMGGIWGSTPRKFWLTRLQTVACCKPVDTGKTWWVFFMWLTVFLGLTCVWCVHAAGALDHYWPTFQGPISPRLYRQYEERLWNHLFEEVFSASQCLWYTGLHRQGPSGSSCPCSVQKCLHVRAPWNLHGWCSK